MRMVSDSVALNVIFMGELLGYFWAGRVRDLENQNLPGNDMYGQMWLYTVSYGSVLILFYRLLMPWFPL
jgi:hypothetical protein